MAPRPRQHHDKLFRLIFSDRKEAAAFLRARLPAALARRFRWSSLRQVPGSFVNQELRGLVTDLLFKVRTTAGGGKGARERCVRLLTALKREPVRGGADYVRVFLGYILNTGPGYPASAG